MLDFEEWLAFNDQGDFSTGIVTENAVRERERQWQEKFDKKVAEYEEKLRAYTDHLCGEII